MDDLSRLAVFLFIVLLFILFAVIIWNLWISFRLKRYKEQLDVDYDNVTANRITTDTLITSNIQSALFNTGELNTEKANVTSLTVKNSNIDNITSKFINTNEITTDILISNELNTELITIAQANIQGINSELIDCDNLNAKGIISTSLESKDIKSDLATIEDLTNTSLKTNKITTDMLDVQDVNATSIIMDSAVIANATIDNISIDFIDTLDISTNNFTTENIVITGASASTGNFNPPRFQTTFFTKSFIQPGCVLHRGIMSISYAGLGLTITMNPDISGNTHQFKSLDSTDFRNSVSDNGVAYEFDVYNNSTVFQGINTVYQFEDICFLYSNYVNTEISAYPTLIPVVTENLDRQLKFICSFEGNQVLSTTNKSLLPQGTYTIHYCIKTT